MKGKNDSNKAKDHSGGGRHSKANRGGSDAAGGKLFLNLTTGATNYSAWAERQLDKVLTKMGRHAVESLREGRYIQRKLVLPEEILVVVPDIVEELSAISGGSKEDADMVDEAVKDGEESGSRTQSSLKVSKFRRAVAIKAAKEKTIETVRNELAKAYAKDLHQDAMDMEKYCGDLKADLTADSIELIRNNVDFDRVEFDLVELWKLIREVHVTKKSKDPQLDKLNKSMALNQLVQGEKESLLLYRKRFERAYEEAEEMGCLIGDEKDRVFKFLQSLNKTKHGAYINHIMQDRYIQGENSATFPQTIEQCSEAAQKFSSLNKLTVSENQLAVIYKSTKEKEKKDKEKEKKDRMKDVVCHGCKKKGHYKRDCPLEKDIDDAVAQETSEEAAEAQTKSAGKSGGGAVKKPGQFFTVHIADVHAAPIYSETMVILDTGANVCGFSNEALLTNIRRCRDTEAISGIDGGEFVPEREGEMLELGVTVKCDPKFAANILSFTMVNETADVLYFNRELNQFEVCYGSYYFVFEKYNGIYACDFSEANVARSILVATVSDNEAQYTAAEVKSARGGA